MFEPKNVIFAQEWNNSEYHNGIQRPTYSKTDTFRRFRRHSQKILSSMIRFTKGNLPDCECRSTCKYRQHSRCDGQRDCIAVQRRVSGKFRHICRRMQVRGSYIQGFEQMNATAFEPLTMHYSRINEVSSYVRTLDKTEQDSLKETIRLICWI